MGSIGGERTVEVAGMKNFYRFFCAAMQAAFLRVGHPFSYKIAASEERCSAAQA